MIHVSLIAPSFPVPAEDVELTKQYLQNQGFQVTVPHDLLGEDLLCAHQDDVRFSHLQEALLDASIDVIWLLRGGYGLTRLIPSLLKMEKPKKEKLFIGFSDGSVLHQFLTQKWGWVSLHGPGANQLSRAKVSPFTIDATLKWVHEGISTYSTPLLYPMNDAARQMRSLAGALTGGNLCLVTCSLGTPWQIESADKILFLEDIDERGYRVDRMLMHLDQAHVLENTKAIIFGDFVGGKEADGTSLILPVLRRFAQAARIPIFSLPGCGHGKENFPLPFNSPLVFSVGSVDPLS